MAVPWPRTNANLIVAESFGLDMNIR
jgi:hypothetical protein